MVKERRNLIFELDFGERGRERERLFGVLPHERLFDFDDSIHINIFLVKQFGISIDFNFFFLKKLIWISVLPQFWKPFWSKKSFSYAIFFSSLNKTNG